MLALLLASCRPDSVPLRGFDVCDHQGSFHEDHPPEAAGARAVFRQPSTLAYLDDREGQ